uniref:G_PROTEIN_RECEP_F1_2 domain-containing protein n=1 Tax=Syphacia muris TaxID=451379 RepID=A0A0N5B0G7_9BILA
MLSSDLISEASTASTTEAVPIVETETDTIAKVSVILSVGLLLNASALVTIIVILRTRSLRNVMGFYLDAGAKML